MSGSAPGLQQQPGVALCVLKNNAYSHALNPQVKMFGSYVRWQADLPPPDDAMPARVAVTTIDAAVRHATGPAAGPVHLNCQLREPLGPTSSAWGYTALAVSLACCPSSSARSW